MLRVAGRVLAYSTRHGEGGGEDRNAGSVRDIESASFDSFICTFNLLSLLVNVKVPKFKLGIVILKTIICTV
jgi:hypothetical protein